MAGLLPFESRNLSLLFLLRTLPCQRYNGLVALCDFLRASPSIKHLTLRRNYIHSEALKFLAEALMRNTSLLKLDLEGKTCGHWFGSTS